MIRRSFTHQNIHISFGLSFESEYLLDNPADLPYDHRRTTASKITLAGKKRLNSPLFDRGKKVQPSIIGFLHPSDLAIQHSTAQHSIH